MRAAATSPALYIGTVGHVRMRPRRNAFRYGLYFLWAEVDGLDRLARSRRLFSHGGRGLFTLNDLDHGPRDGTPLRPWMEAILRRAGIDIEGGPVMLLAFPRVLRGRFYPVSFWYCYHPDGSVRAILAEVNNTFRQHHNYLLHNGGAPIDWTKALHAVKVFHVSPFIPMDARYEFQFSPPGERLSISLLDVVEGTPLLLAQVDLERRPLSDAEMLRAFLRYGPMSARAWLLIRWQALRLIRLRIRYLRKPPLPAEETT
jgi:DUF1365 family protein